MRTSVTLAFGAKWGLEVGSSSNLVVLEGLGMQIVFEIGCLSHWGKKESLCAGGMIKHDRK